MPRKSSYAKDPTHAPRKKGPAPVPQPAPITQEWLVVTGQSPAPAVAAVDSLEQVALPGAGRYSVNRDSNGTAYHKWRWSAGPLAGRYVMFVADHSERLEVGLLGLIEKVHRAEEGSVYATLDRYL